MVDKANRKVTARLRYTYIQFRLCERSLGKSIAQLHDARLSRKVAAPDERDNEFPALDAQRCGHHSNFSFDAPAYLLILFV